ncbi:hypothetical protein [Streptomyces achromogenes]|uniref:hypothetical protein n=1 Tax=Streptomyces achromogenes TaxID=67255 RepID=UPI00342AE05C
MLTVAGHRPVDPECAGLPLLRLAPLSTADAAALLDDAAPGALDPRVRDEITAAAEGNPGLLLGVVHRLTAAQLGGLAPLPCPLVDAEALTELTAPGRTGPAAHDRRCPARIGGADRRGPGRGARREVARRRRITLASAAGAAC